MNRPGLSGNDTAEQPSRLPAIAWGAILASACGVFFGNLRFGKDVLGVGYEDDFYYYAQVARNLARHGSSTFDGIHLTNGYHPLWLLVLTLVTKVFDVGGWLHSATQLPFAFALEMVQLLLVVAIAYFVYRVSGLFCSLELSCCIQLLVASIALVLVRTGMEVGLTIALIFALLWFRLRPGFRWTGVACLSYGLIASCMILSRLDSILLAGLLFVLDVVPNAPDLSGRIRNGLLFCLGGLPVAAYLAVNEMVFGVLMPVSGTAKQLRLHKTPSLHGVLSFTGFMVGPKWIVFGLCAVSTLAGLGLLLIKRGIVRPGVKGVFWAVLLFPLVHALAVSTMSDWNVWQWYLYAWPVSGALGAMAIAQAGSPKGEAWHRASVAGFVASVVFLIVYAAGMVYSSSPRRDLTYVAALEIKQFAASHPGIYAMGDRSGAVGYFVDVPVVQTEGLMMDKGYLDNIRRQRDLGDVLKDYHVRYYISTRSAPDADGCYPVKEPWQAGPDSPFMSARICKAPLLTITHDNFTNHIFDMQ